MVFDVRQSRDPNLAGNALSFVDLAIVRFFEHKWANQIVAHPHEEHHDRIFQPIGAQP
ncbi:MAG: hypothetical protein M3Z21_15840 [Pseudomonadota bacterium]|nr:hypothetical protein [Pseudomonadota bacterium]